MRLTGHTMILCLKLHEVARVCSRDAMMAKLTRTEELPISPPLPPLWLRSKHGEFFFRIAGKELTRSTKSLVANRPLLSGKP